MRKLRLSNLENYKGSTLIAELGFNLTHPSKYQPVGLDLPMPGPVWPMVTGTQ
jgi:hypothetical protein